MGWPNNFVQGVYNSDNELVGVDDGAGGQIGLASTFTWAEARAITADYIGAAIISDINGGTYMVSNGIKWRFLNNTGVLYTNPTEYVKTDVTTIAGSLTASDILFSIPLEIAILNDNDFLKLEIVSLRSDAAIGVGYKIYHSSSPSILGTSLGIDVNTANATHNGIFKFKKTSATSIYQGNSIAGNDTSSGSSGLVGARTFTGLTNMDTTKTYLHIVPFYGGSGGTTNDMTFSTVVATVVNS